MAKTLAVLAAVIMGAAAVLCLFNLAVVASARAQHPPLGQLYTVEGRSMHLYCVGQGSPTIVLEAGAGDDVLYWQTIQPGLAKLTRVCAYDRAGIGWSDPDPGKRDSETIARQLHGLLQTAGVQRPMIMVGASAGGFHVREYVREYPDDVVAVAFLDSSSPYQVDELPGSRKWYDGEVRGRPKQVTWERLKVWSGWPRLMGECHDTLPPALEQYQAASDAEQCRPNYVGGDLGEFLNFETSGREAERLTTLGDRPLLVISQDPDRSKTGWTADAIAGQPVWNREQEALKAMSSRSWRVIARGSRHHVHHDRADVVLREIEHLVTLMRGGAAPMLGTTTVE